MMVKKSANPSGSTKEGLEGEVGGLFGTRGTADDLLCTVPAPWINPPQRTAESARSGLGDGARGVYGFSIRTGRGGQGADRIERFGNSHATTEGVVVDDVHEPLVDVFDEGSE